MTSIYDQDLPRVPANHAALSPLSYLERSAEVYPERLAIVHGQGAQAFRQTWRETYQRCRRLASALRSAGLDNRAHGQRCGREENQDSRSRHRRPVAAFLLLRRS